MNNRILWQDLLPSNLAMAMTLYDFTVDAHTALILDNHRRANPDHPTAQRCQKNFEYTRSIFEAVTGLDWESTFERLGEVATILTWKVYLEGISGNLQAWRDYLEEKDEN